MSDFRDLQAKLQQIEESYFSDLDLELQEFRRANKDLPADQLVALAREKYGQEAASFISDKIEREADLADYEASDPQPHMRDEIETPELFPGTREMLNKLSVVDEDEGFWGDMENNNPFEGLTEAEIEYLKYPKGHEPAPMPERHILDGYDWMHVPDDVIQMMKSFEHKMKSQKVWDIGVSLADGEDKLWKVMQWRAEEVMDTYRGSGDGIGSSDMNHFVRGVFSDIGEDDIWGWDKKDESVEEGSFRHEEDSISQQIKSLLAQGKKVFSKIGGAVGEIVSTEGRLVYIKIRGSKNPAVTSFDSKDNVEIVGNIDHYDVIEHWDDKEIDESELDEDRGRVVEVPPEFQGTDPDNSLGGTSRGVEAFLRDLGPDDSVDTEVVDPETGELLDWPTKGTRRDQGQKEYEKQEAERKEREQKDHEEGHDSPYLYAPGLEKDPENAWQAINDLKYDREFTDFYNIVWKSVREASGEPFDLGSDAEDWGELDYDVDIDMPVAIKRTDGKKFNKQDRQNFDMINKIFRAATFNIGVQYVGSSNEGTVARFIPNFM